MNNTIRPMSNVSFQAKLDVSSVMGSKQRWKNIAKIFEEKTKNCPDDIFVAEGSFKKGLDFNLLDDGLLSSEDAAVRDNSVVELEKMSDKNVAKNIVDIFRYLKKERANVVKENKFADSLGLDDLDGKFGTDLTDKLYELMAEVRTVKREEFIEKHPAFANGGLLI